jgi:hypothetical protein
MFPVCSHTILSSPSQRPLAITKPASAGSSAREDTMSVSKFLTEFLGFAGLITSLYGWTLVGHVMVF